MKKKTMFLSCLLLAVVAPFSMLLTGCGEQFIEERTYDLIAMQVVEDNTDYLYSQFSKGDFTESFCGSMSISDCKLDVGTSQSVMNYEDSASGLQATYVFDVYTGSDVYPAYTFTSYSISINGVNVTEISPEDLTTFDSTYSDLYTEVLQFSNVCARGDTSIQLVTQNKSLLAHIIMLDEQGQLLFMGILYGY